MASISVSHASAADFSAVDSYAFPSTDGHIGEKGGRQTNSVVIMQDGKIIYERYARGFKPDGRQISWSVAKTVMGTLAGVAIAEGKITLDDSICQHGYKKNCGIKVRHILEWSTCLRWAEEYENSEQPTASDVIQMLYGKGNADMAAYVASRPAECEPGRGWRYSSGDSNLLSGVLRHAYGKAYADFPNRALFKLLGMNSVFWERDRSGTYVASSSIFATPRDYAKFGQFILQGGVWNGKSYLPPGWLSYVTTPPAALYERVLTPDNGSSGKHWWLNKAIPEIGLTTPWPDAPGDTIAAWGHWGQFIFVIPSLRAVVVRTGETKDDSFSINDFLKAARMGLEARP